MVKKVLLSLPKDSSYYPGMMRAFHFLKITVKFFDSRKFTPREKVVAALFKNANTSVVSLNARLLNEVETFHPDVLFVMKGELILPETIAIIRKSGIKTVNWFPDHVDSLELAHKLSGAYDYFFHFDPYAISQLKKRGRKNINYLPFAADILPSDPALKTNILKKYTLTFVGNFNSLREDYLSQIADLELEIWGDTRWKNSKLSENYHGPLPFSELSKVLSETKIGLNIQHDYPSSGAVLRVFEVLKAMTFLLSENRKDLNRLFTIGKDLDVFRTSSELRKKVLHYLANPDQTVSIASCGFKTVKKSHTYVHRLNEVLGIINYG